MKLIIDGLDPIEATLHYHDGKLAALELAGRHLEPTEIFDHLFVTPQGERDPVMVDWLNKKYYTRGELNGLPFKVVFTNDGKQMSKLKDFLGEATRGDGRRFRIPNWANGTWFEPIFIADDGFWSGLTENNVYDFHHGEHAKGWVEFVVTGQKGE